MRKVKVTAWIVSTVLCSGLVLSGCGRNQPEETEVVAEIIELDLDPVEEYETIGDPTSPIEVLMTNEMGRTITGLSVKTPEEIAFPDNIMDIGQTFETGVTAEFYYDPNASAQDAGMETVVTETVETEDEYGYEDEYTTEETVTETQAEPTALILLGTSADTYSLQVTMENGSSYIISTFDLDDMDEVTLKFEDGVAYLEYTSLTTNQLVNTKESESAIQEYSTAVQTVIDMIAALPEVTESNMNSAEPGIVTARAAYDALSDDQKEYVTNYYLLEEREYELALLNGEIAVETESEDTYYEEDYYYDDGQDWDDDYYDDYNGGYEDDGDYDYTNDDDDDDDYDDYDWDDEGDDDDDDDGDDDDYYEDRYYPDDDD